MIPSSPTLLPFAKNALGEGRSIFTSPTYGRRCCINQNLHYSPLPKCFSLGEGLGVRVFEVAQISLGGTYLAQNPHPQPFSPRKNHSGRREKIDLCNNASHKWERSTRVFYVEGEGLLIINRCPSPTCHLLQHGTCIRILQCI